MSRLHKRTRFITLCMQTHTCSPADPPTVSPPLSDLVWVATAPGWAGLEWWCGLWLAEPLESWSRAWPAWRGPRWTRRGQRSRLAGHSGHHCSPHYTRTRTHPPHRPDYSCHGDRGCWRMDLQKTAPKNNITNERGEHCIVLSNIVNCSSHTAIYRLTITRPEE